MRVQRPILTSDRLIRTALKEVLDSKFREEPNTRIIEELGIVHGTARIDVAVVNGNLQGFELKSDRDTLSRLPEQMRVFNSVFDQVTLVVGKQHVFEAINMVPEWWGIVVAKISTAGGGVTFSHIRDVGDNPDSTSTAVVSLLWREEALRILEECGKAEGVRSKNRDVVYARLTKILFF